MNTTRRTDCLPVPTDRNQGWPGVYAVLYTDTINGEQVSRDDLWIATTRAIKDEINRAQTEAYADGRQDEADANGAASRLIDAWVTAHGKPIPWESAVEITAIVTKMPDAEKQRLLELNR